MEEEIFIVIYEKLCVMCRGEKEIRLIRAYSKNDAYDIAKKHGKRFYPGWTITINNVIWNEDDTAFVYFICD